MAMKAKLCQLTTDNKQLHSELKRAIVHDILTDEEVSREQVRFRDGFKLYFHSELQ